MLLYLLLINPGLGTAIVYSPTYSMWVQNFLHIVSLEGNSRETLFDIKTYFWRCPCPRFHCKWCWIFVEILCLLYFVFFLFVTHTYIYMIYIVHPHHCNIVTAEGMRVCNWKKMSGWLHVITCRGGAAVTGQTRKLKAAKVEGMSPEFHKLRLVSS